MNKTKYAVEWHVTTYDNQTISRDIKRTDSIQALYDFCDGLKFGGPRSNIFEFKFYDNPEQIQELWDHNLIKYKEKYEWYKNQKHRVFM